MLRQKLIKGRKANRVVGAASFPFYEITHNNNDLLPRTRLATLGILCLAASAFGQEPTPTPAPEPTPVVCEDCQQQEIDNLIAIRKILGTLGGIFFGWKMTEYIFKHV